MHTDHVCSCLVTSAAQEQINKSCDDHYPSIGLPLISALPVDPITGYQWEPGSVSLSPLDIVPVQQSKLKLVRSITGLDIIRSMIG